jgi:hypothetical protein
MYLEKIKHRNKRGRVYFHHLVTGGKFGRRKYVSRAALPSVKEEISADKARRKFLSSLRSAFRHGKPGPVATISETQRVMLECSGYRLRGGLRVTRDRKKFFGKKQVEFRHSMLSEAAREIARTPDDLARIEKKAISLQAAFSASKRSGAKFDDFKTAMFSAEAASMTGGTRTGASSPRSARHSGDISR